MLGFTPGDELVEKAIHQRLKPHRARGRTIYHATPEVLSLVNSWRKTLGRPPLP